MNAGESARLRARHPDEPWLWQSQWASGRIDSTERSRLAGAWFLTLFWNAVSSVVFLVVPDELAKGNTAALLALIFPLVGLGILLWAVRATIRWRKFGTSTLELSGTPVPLGGELRARLHTRLDPPPETMRLVLTCVRRDHRGDSASDTIVWLEERTIDGHEMRREVDGTVVPVAFVIPADAPEAAPDRKDESVHWKLHASAAVAGVDYASSFELPVFHARDATPQPPLATPATAARAIATDTVPATFERAQATVHVGLGTRGHEFYFGPGRNSGAAASFGVMFGIFAAAAYGITRTGIPLFIAGVCGFFALLLLFALLQLSLGTSRVEITGDHVLVRKSLLGITTKTRRIPLDDVANITLHIGMSQTETAMQAPRAWYDIRLHRKSGRRVTLGSNVADKREAEWIVREMTRAMGR